MRLFTLTEFLHVVIEVVLLFPQVLQLLAELMIGFLQL